MTTHLTSDQEAIVQSAVENGFATSAEAFVSEALEEKHYQAGLDHFIREVIVPRIQEREKDPSQLKNSADSLAEILGD